MNKVVQKL